MMWQHLMQSIPLGSVLGIPIRLHVTFFLVLAFQLLGSIYYGGWTVLLWLILLGPVLLLTVLIHELGHCLAARSVGSTVESILLWPLGGLAFIGPSASPKADIWVAVAGPLTHIPMVGVWLLLLLPVYHASTGSWSITLYMPWPDAAHLWHAVCAGAVIMNISLFAFNLLVPAYPLDGGRILANGLLWAGVPPRHAALITVCVATPLGLGVLVYGIIVFQMVTIMVACFILFATYQLFQTWRTDSVQQHPLFTASCNNQASGHASQGGADPCFRFGSVNDGSTTSAGKPPALGSAV